MDEKDWYFKPVLDKLTQLCLDFGKDHVWEVIMTLFESDYYDQLKKEKK